VRGIAIKCILPLDQIGIFDTARAWETREPETLDWIDTFRPDEVFVDIGSSFGTESLYAAKKQNGPQRIIAFDCDLLPSHYFTLNLRINAVRNVDFYFMPLSDKPEFIEFSCPSNKHLDDLGVLASPANRIIYHLHALPFDDFCSFYNVSPNHIKIDVDGYEVKVLDGMKEVLAMKSLRSILIEITKETRDRVISILNYYGFKLLNPGPFNHETQNLIFRR
jgi:FkbM family methyltransferase